MGMNSDHANLGLPGIYNDSVSLGRHRGYIGWAPEGYKDGRVFQSWSEFKEGVFALFCLKAPPGDFLEALASSPHLIVVDFFFDHHAAEEDSGAGFVAVEEPNLSLSVCMVHPRHGSVKGVEIKNITDGDLVEVKSWLGTGFRKQMSHFAWALEK